MSFYGTSRVGMVGGAAFSIFAIPLGVLAGLGSASLAAGIVVFAGLAGLGLWTVGYSMQSVELREHLVVVRGYFGRESVRFAAAEVADVDVVGARSPTGLTFVIRLRTGRRVRIWAHPELVTWFRSRGIAAPY